MAAGRDDADRIETEADVDSRRRRAVRRNRCGHRGGDVFRLAVGLDIDRDPGVEMDVAQERCDRRRAGVEAEAESADRSREYERKSARAVLEVDERLGVGGSGVGVLDARQHLPWRARRPTDDRPCRRFAAVERLDGDAVIGLRDEPALERRALEDAGDELEPRLAIGWRKFSK